jgi:DNA-binding NtrC family response regulator
MIHGETGTGKELAALLLHRLSRRARAPFEAVDCSSIPRELIESELFGHVKGAFTGATRDFRGAFERADGGTLLLDEIGDMDLRSQTRLLRVLQEGKVRPLGGDRARTVNVRVVAATNKDLAAMVRAGTFREDLYYRVHVCPLWIPSLRERGDDRIVLFDHFMSTHAAEVQRAPRGLGAAARARLAQAEFPGNVRQLQNVVRRLLVQGANVGHVGADELDRVLAQAAAAARPAPDVRAGAVPGPSPAAAPTVADVGAWVLERLRAHRFNLSAAAKELQEQRAQGVSRGAIPVFDRGALDYYLCGEFFEHLVAADFDVGAAVESVAGSKALVPRVLRKADAFLRPLRGVGSAADLARARSSFRRLPERYAPVLDRVCDAVAAGQFNPRTNDPKK